MGFETRPYAECFIVSSDNLSLYFRDYGSHSSGRTPLLCLPGLTRNSKDFHDLALRYGDERRVVCPDYRGRGRSDRDPDWRHYTVRTLLEDVLNLLAATDLYKVVVIGTSLGGILAMGLAVARPRALAGVVLNDIGPEIELEGLRQIVEWVSVDRPQPDLETAAASLKRNAYQIGIRDDAGWRKLASTTYTEDPDGHLHFDYDLALVRPVVALVRKGLTSSDDLWPAFRALRHVPALLIRGERSTILSDKTARAMIVAKPDLAYVEVPGLGHAPLLDEPESLAAIDDFLARH